MLTLNQVQESLPVNFRNNMTQDMVDELNALSDDPEEARYMRDNFVSFSNVLMEGRYKVGDYVKAVMYVSLKAMGKSNIQAYKETFPERYQPMVDAGKPQNHIASIVTAYNKGQLVTKVAERAMVPIWLMNQDAVQKAINVQVEIMEDGSLNARDRTAAANSLLTHLKKPEVQKAELQVEVAVSDGMKLLQDRITEMATIQQQTIESRALTAQEVAALPMNIEDAEEVE